MFGYVTASWGELTRPQQQRYGSIYCGICRRIHAQAGQTARLALSYDMAFLALLFMSLYEPEEDSGRGRCLTHPVKKRPWIDNPYIRYAADMNVALAYYNCLDDWQDEGKRGAKWLASLYGRYLPEIEGRYGRQCQAIRHGVEALARLEKENCPDPDAAAATFGALMAELLVHTQDRWEQDLRQLGDALGRCIYLMDAMLDYEKDEKRGKYNPFLAQGGGKNPETWEEYLVLTMGRCTAAYERLPLVQDKQLLDNILYSGIWGNYRAGRRKEGKAHV